MKNYNRNQLGPHSNADQEWNKRLGRRGEDVYGEGEPRDQDLDPRRPYNPSERGLASYKPGHTSTRNQQRGEYHGSPYDVGNYASHYDDRAYGLEDQRISSAPDDQTSARRNFRGKGPRSYKRSDERILEDVNDRLFVDPYIDASDIEVAIDNGDVILKGSVEDRMAKRRAEDIIETVPGVKNVENLIRVDKTNERVVGPVRSNAREELM